MPANGEQGGEGLTKDHLVSRRTFLKTPALLSSKLERRSELLNKDWTIAAGIDTSAPLTVTGPRGEQVILGKTSGSIVLVDSSEAVAWAESISGQVNKFRDYQGVYKAAPGISAQAPEGFHVNVVACHTTPGWPGEDLKKAEVSEEWLLNGKRFSVSQRRDMRYQQWNDARGNYPPESHPYFRDGEIFFRLFGGTKNSFGFTRPSDLRGYEAIVLTSCEGKYVGGEVGHDKRFALLLEPIK